MNAPSSIAALDPVKRAIVEQIRRALLDVPGICSLTFVGSFIDRPDLSGISDIDTVVVFDKLTPSRFADAVGAVSRLTGAAIGFPGRTVRVNATLGPLKFDNPGQVVIHLMPYDRASHRQHVLRSPFTCFDWERSHVHWGQALSEIYPVGGLEPGDFVTARRGLANYLADLEAGTLSFRRFENSGETMVEVEDSITLDRRHQGEYAFHIIRNLITNLLKLLRIENRSWDEQGLEQDWVGELPDLAHWLPFYKVLSAVKTTRGDAFPPDTLAKTRQFVREFSASIDQMLQNAVRLRFVRHARTGLNDGTFLGRGRNPPLLNPEQVSAASEEFVAVYSSPLRRAIETANAMKPGVSIEVDSRLAEINYGEAEGLTAGDLRERFPAIAEAWDRGEDTCFPGGEATSDVLRRVRSFLETAADAAGRSLVITHNVVLRVIVADLLNLDLRHAHRIPIEHLEPLDVCRVGRGWHPDWGPVTKSRLLDGFVGWPNRG